jgi:uncharacterized protein (TIRG00374 family)
MKKWHFKPSRYLPVLGILLYIIIILKTSPSKLISTIMDMDVIFFILALLLNLIVIPLKAAKWKLIIDTCGISYPFHKCISAWLIGYSAGLITPGRIGDFYRSLYLRDYGNKSLGLCLSTVIFDRIIDVSVMILMAFFGILMLSNMFKISQNLIIFVIFILFFVLIIFIILKINLKYLILMPFFYRMVPKEHQPTIKDNLVDFFDSLSMNLEKKSLLIFQIFLAIISWLFITLQNYLILHSLNPNGSYLFMLCITPFICMIELLPISISGLGTRDAALIFLLSLIAIPAEISIALSLSILISAYFIGFVGLLIWLRNPLGNLKDHD